ncbi:peptidoglycan DD-metalloendopeptidase family protein [Oscillospiraceae bacterium MB08-C2-2]|nr:peptidoglycan DD-metalloendopeptidase family protein [Oscillospiraceae bacterium MB08-C2-2]
MLRTEKRRLSFLAFTMAFVLIITGSVRPLLVYANDDEENETQASSSTTSKYQSELDAISKKLKELENSSKEIQRNIADAKTQKDKETANKNSLDTQINITKSEIELLEERITVLEQKIADKEQEIVDKQAEVDANYEQFRKRLRAMYMNDEASVLGLVLGADSFADFLTKTETVVRISDHDRKLMENLTQERIQLEGLKADLEDNMADVEETRLETENKKKDLGVKLQEVNLKIHEIADMEKQFNSELDKNKAEMARMRAEMDEIYKRIEWDKSPYVGGEMAWPLPGFTKISSEYGYRFNGADFHTGMDITGSNVYGQSIVAANAGTVKFVNWTYTAGRGYGIYVIVDHGGGVSTLYAHCSSIAVKVGDVVTRGQAIASVGSTGWSTGPHLHFEVRIDGKHTNPKPYVMKK